MNPEHWSSDQKLVVWRNLSRGWQTKNGERKEAPAKWHPNLARLLFSWDERTFSKRC